MVNGGRVDGKLTGVYGPFAQVADSYERGRPSYPEDAVRWLVGFAPRIGQSDQGGFCSLRKKYANM